MRSATNKPYLEILGRPLLCYTLDTLQNNALIATVILICYKDEVAFCRREIVEKYGYSKVKAVVEGGRERQDSVLCGLHVLSEEIQWVVIHDGVRPLLSPAVLTLALDTAFHKGPVVVGVPAKDTVKKIRPDFTIQETPERHSMWLIQTPQVFPKDVLLQAYSEAVKYGWRGTDDASLVERIGVPVHVVQGEYKNIKVTTPEDLIYVEEMLRKKHPCE